MGEYIVRVARERTEYANVEIGADNPNQACDRALDVAAHFGDLLTWEPSTDTLGKPYLGGSPIEVGGKAA